MYLSILSGLSEIYYYIFRNIIGIETETWAPSAALRFVDKTRAKDYKVSTAPS